MSLKQSVIMDHTNFESKFLQETFSEYIFGPIDIRPLSCSSLKYKNKYKHLVNKFYQIYCN